MNGSRLIGVAMACTVFAGVAWAEDAAPAAPEGRAQHETAPRARAKKAERKAAPASAEAAAGEPAPAAPAPAPSVGQVCTLSRDAVLANAAVDVTAAQRLAQLRAGAQAEVAQANAALQTDAQALAADKRAPDDAGLKKAKADLEDRRRQLVQRADLLTRRLDATQKTVSLQIQTAAGPVLDAVERANGCKLLLARESVLDARGVTDITQPTIEAMNAQLQPRPFDLVDLN